MLETKRQLFNMQIEPEWKRMLQILAKHERRSMTAVVDLAVRERFQAAGLKLPATQPSQDAQS